MKKKIIFLFFTVLFFCVAGHAQFSKYIIRFKHKGTNPYTLANPSQYLTARAIARRTKYGLAIDSSDLPVTPRFIDSVRLAGAVTILNTSKWLNQVAIQTTDAAALAKINNLSFVLSTAPIAARYTDPITPVNKQLDPALTNGTAGTDGSQGVADYFSYGQSFPQIHIHNGEFLHNRGFRGQGMQMTILDAGFYHYLSLPTFDSVRNNNQILGTWDFVANEASVDEDYLHGMQCFSTIAANIPGTFVGTAPKASFYLYRTEDISSEYPIEEQNWAAGAERADSLGVDVFSTSLGYTAFDNASLSHTYADMDGNTTIIAKAADFAAKKGILVVVAAGNEGTNAWHYITTPADADSSLAVGAVNTSGAVGAFSSYGPSSDGQVKPAVASVGVNTVIANSSNGQPTNGSGTSFACPNMAGLATCLWQAFPEINNMGIITVLEQSATKFTTPDDRVGYGIPDAKNAYVRLIKQLFTKQVTLANCKTTIQFTVKTDSAITVLVERKLPTASNYTTLTTLTSTGAFISNNFTYQDDLSAIASGSIQYRLTMKVANDTTFYLDSAAVTHSQTACITGTGGNPGVTEKITISPNPVNDNLFVAVIKNNAAKVDISIVDAGGKKVYSNSKQQLSGGQTYSVPMKALSKGIYFVSVYVNGKKEMVKKIVKG